MQLSVIVAPQVLFSDYIYTSGTSRTIVQHNEALSRMHVRNLGLTKDDLVVEVASNDGSLLASFQNYGVQVLGIEPATNLAGVANERGIRTANLFFGRAVAGEIAEQLGKASLICANNVLAHVADPVGFLIGCRKLAKRDGVISVEFPHLMTLLDGLEYDTIYHEHLSYFSMRAIATAFERAELAIFEVQQIPIHGGSLRVMARQGKGHGQAVERLLACERERGMDDLATWQRFANSVARSKQQLVESLDVLVAKGKTIAGYGAPAKGNTLLNYCGIGPDRIGFTVDRNKMKVGRFTPGMRIPVKPVQYLLQEQPDVTLILPWNIATEVRCQEDEYIRAGGRFMVPLPELQEIE